MRRLKDKGVFISKAIDEELSDMFKQIEGFFGAQGGVAAWRADPQ